MCTQLVRTKNGEAKDFYIYKTKKSRSFEKVTLIFCNIEHGVHILIMPRGSSLNVKYGACSDMLAVTFPYAF